MSDPAIVPLTFTRGNDEEYIFDFEDDDFAPADIDEDVFIFRAIDSSDNEIFRKSTATVDSGFEIYSASSVYLHITYEETRDMTGRGVTYSIEHRAGSMQKTIQKGPIDVITDANDDV